MKTREILKEWKKFLNESTKLKFSKEDIGKKVEYSPCCSICVKFLKMDQEETKSGKLTGVDGNNIEIGDRKENTVYVDKKMVPQCCVKLK